MAQNVRDVMTADPITVPPGASLAEAARLMRDHDTGALLVAEEGRLQGIVTDRDIVVRGVATDSARTVGDVCSAELVRVAATDTVDAAAGVMREHAVRRLPVVDGDRPVGIVSLGDLAAEQDPGSALGEISRQPGNN